MMQVGLPKLCAMHICGTPKRIRVTLYRLMVRNRPGHARNEGRHDSRFEWRVSRRNPLNRPASREGGRAHYGFFQCAATAFQQLRIASKNFPHLQYKLVKI